MGPVRCQGFTRGSRRAEAVMKRRGVCCERWENEQNKTVAGGVWCWRGGAMRHHRHSRAQSAVILILEFFLKSFSFKKNKSNKNFIYHRFFLDTATHQDCALTIFMDTKCMMLFSLNAFPKIEASSDWGPLL